MFVPLFFKEYFLSNSMFLTVIWPMRHIWRKLVMIIFNFVTATGVGLAEETVYSRWRAHVLNQIVTLFVFAISLIVEIPL